MLLIIIYITINLLIPIKIAYSSFQWIDSSTNIHAFLTFDAKATKENIDKYGDKIDYVWGSSESKVPYWRGDKSPNKNVILSRPSVSLLLILSNCSQYIVQENLAAKCES